MKEITEEKCIALIKENFPKFSSYLEGFSKDFGPELGTTVQMIPFAEYTIDILKFSDEHELKRIFNLVEFLLNRGNQSAQDAIATGFLESLMHLPSSQPFMQFILGFCSTKPSSLQVISFNSLGP